MTNLQNGVKILPKMSIAWVGRTNVTDRRQTDDRQTDRQTDGRRHIANMNLSSRSLKTDNSWSEMIRKRDKFERIEFWVFFFSSSSSFCAFNSSRNIDLSNTPPHHTILNLLLHFCLGLLTFSSPCLQCSLSHGSYTAQLSLFTRSSVTSSPPTISGERLLFLGLPSEWLSVHYLTRSRCHTPISLSHRLQPGVDYRMLQLATDTIRLKGADCIITAVRFSLFRFLII